MIAEAAIVSTATMLTPERLTKILRDQDVVREARVTHIEQAPVGNGLMADSARFTISYDRAESGTPATLVGKFSTQDQRARESCRQTGAYLTETRFYQEMAASASVAVPRAYYADIDEETMDFGLILEDMSPARPGDQLVGATPEETMLAIEQAAALHGPRWNDPELKRTGWLEACKPILARMSEAFPGFMTIFHERYDGVLEPEYMNVCDRFASRAGEFLLRDGPFFTTVHTDYRLDNMLFDARDGEIPLAILDWQTISCKSGALDLAHFLGLNIDVERRRANEPEYLAYYLEQLGRFGVRDFTKEDLQREYRIEAYYGLFNSVAGACVAKRTPRGDQMFLTMVRGACAQMIDLETLRVAL